LIQILRAFDEESKLNTYLMLKKKREKINF